MLPNREPDPVCAFLPPSVVFVVRRRRFRDAAAADRVAAARLRSAARSCCRRCQPAIAALLEM